MKRLLPLVVGLSLFLGWPFIPWDPGRLVAEESLRFMLQTSAFPTLNGAQKEIERLKALGVAARYLPKEDQARNTWYAVYIDVYPTREEAVRQGNQLIQKGVIRNFFIFPYRGSEEAMRKKAEDTETSVIRSVPPSPKEGKSLLDKRPLFFGPIVIKENDTNILMTIGLDRKVFPRIYTQKNDLNSRLFITFHPVDKLLVPIDFRKDQHQALISFSVAQKGTDCTFILVLNPAFNYEVSQNYFEKEKLYSLRIRWEAAAGTEKAKEQGT